MASPNCDFIRKQLFKISKIRLLDWENNFEISSRPYALNTTHMTYQLKRQRAVDAGPRKLPPLLLLTCIMTLGLRKMKRRRRKQRRRNEKLAS
jgi:hypothetical protein